MNLFPPASKGFAFYARLEPSLATLPLVHSRSDHPKSFIKDLQRIALEDLLGAPVANRPMAQAVRAGLLLVAEAWEEAHGVAQDLETVEGSYWHGIVHRREPDVGNATYWFRRVESHPIFETLCAVDRRVSLPTKQAFEAITRSGAWDPFTFIELCTGSHEAGSADLRQELMVLQAQEIHLLLEYCLRHATPQEGRR